MARVSPRDLDRVLNAIRVLHEPAGLMEFPAQVMAAVRCMIDCDVMGYTELQLASRWGWAVVDDPEQQQVADKVMSDFIEYSDQHPVVRYFSQQGHEGVAKISDFLTRPQWKALDLYREVYRHLDVNAQMIAEVIAESDQVIGAVANRRGRDFTERDRSKLQLLQPHLRIAYRSAKLRTQLEQQAARSSAVLRLLQHHVFVIDEQGRIIEMDDEARRFLLVAFPEWSGQSNELPIQLMAWVTRQILAVRELDATPAVDDPSPSCPRGMQLVARLLPDIEPGRFFLVLCDSARAAAADCSEQLGLTTREAEVLYWVAQGKTNRQIAGLLHISYHTVKNHLANIFEKLDVDSRTLAVQRALPFLLPR